MTWVSIPNASLEVGKPARSIDVVALRDNPIAIANGDAGAPGVELAALIPASNIGLVGSYTIARQVVGTTGIVAGATIAGSSLRYSNTTGDYIGGAASGTWRLMGEVGNAGLFDKTSLWTRIA